MLQRLQVACPILEKGLFLRFFHTPLLLYRRLAFSRDLGLNRITLAVDIAEEKSKQTFEGYSSPGIFDG